MFSRMKNLPNKHDDGKGEMMDLYNVYAVNIETGERQIIGENKTLENAEAICNFAVARRGVETHFYTTEKA